jgi:catechol 2,3-dioxygenase-like lactoylglutathione lyase family enzyme
MTRLIHVSLGVPVGGADIESQFLQALGYTRLATPPDAPTTSRRFEGVDGVQVHLSEDPGHRAPDRAHVAIDLDSGLDEVAGQLSAAGWEYEVFSFEAYRLIWCRDPAGNRWELRGTPDRVSAT